jgi:hypothetical protein
MRGASGYEDAERQVSAIAPEGNGRVDNTRPIKVAGIVSTLSKMPSGCSTQYFMGMKRALLCAGRRHDRFSMQ